MSLTVLFDLDDTLLHTNTHVFLPEYFKALGKAFSHLAPPEKLTQQIHHAVGLMVANQDPGRLLSEIFAENFYAPLGTNQTDCQGIIDTFYRDEYPKLQSLTQAKPETPGLIDWCQSQDMRVAIATNPLFPQAATRQRVEWAGLNPEDFVFYSTFDDFHFTKPNPTYYAESLGRLGWPEMPAVMIGDNLTHDLLPMEKMGYKTYWIDPEVDKTDRPHGSLAAIKPLLEDLKDKKDPLRTKDPEVQMAILRSSPAVLDTWLRQVPDNVLHRKPTKHEWSINEVFWHLADIEKEVYQPQWEQLLSNPSSPITAVNTSNWAEGRAYQTRDTETAFATFLKTRKNSLAMIETLWDKGLFEITVPHTVFNETTVNELVAFSAKHDRLHLRQCFNLLNIYKIC